MQRSYRDLLKHSSIYGLGQVLSRFASFLLLPLYTSYLTPTQYGCIAILDLSSAALGILIGGGVASAVIRYQADAENDEERDRIWWTSLGFIGLLATLVLATCWWLRQPMAHLMLGPGVQHGSLYFALILPTLWLELLGQIPDIHLRVRKWSGTAVSLSLLQLHLNIALNVYFLVGCHLGVTGILLGNLISRCVVTVISLAIFLCNRGAFQFHAPVIRHLMRFGAPLIATAFLSMLMHQSDRYLLRLFVGIDRVGIYSFAYQIGSAVNSLFLLPFASIWAVVVYEIAKQPDARETYAKVFKYFVFAFSLGMLGISLFARPVLALMAAEEYMEAASIVPLICLAYTFFSLHEHFKVPALLAKRTVRLLPTFLVAACCNLLANLVMIPLWGIYGAAWASVATYGIFSFVGLWCYRQIDRFEYPLIRCGAVLAGMSLSYVGCRALEFFEAHPVVQMFVAGLVWSGWVVVLFGHLISQMRWATFEKIPGMSLATRFAPAWRRPNVSQPSSVR